VICTLIITAVGLRGEFLAQKGPVTPGNNWGDVTAFAGVTAQILATVFSLTISISLVALQIASEIYTIRIHDLFTNSIRVYLLLSIIFFINPFFSEWIRLPESAQWIVVFSSLLTGMLFTVCYIMAVVRVLRPRDLQKALGKRIDKILREIERERSSSSVKQKENTEGRINKLREDLSSYLSGLVEIARAVASRGDRMMLEDIIDMMIKKWSHCSDSRGMDLFMKAYYNICSDLVNSNLTDMLSAALDFPQEILDGLKELDEKRRLRIIERIGLACVETLKHSTHLGLVEETRLLRETASKIISTLEKSGFVELGPDYWIESLDSLISVARLRGGDFGNQVYQAALNLRKRVAVLKPMPESIKSAYSSSQ